MNKLISKVNYNDKIDFKYVINRYYFLIIGVFLGLIFFKIQITYVLISIILLLLIYWRVEIGLLLIIFSFQYDALFKLVIHFQILGILITPIKILSFLTLTSLAYSYFIKKQKYSLPKNSLFIYLIFFLLISFISTLIAKNIIYSLETLIRLSFLFLLFILIVLIINDENKFKNGMYIIILANVLPIFLSLIVYIFTKLNILIYPINRLNHILISESGRYVGFLGNPNEFASSLLLLIPYLFIFIIYSKNYLNKLFGVSYLFITLIIFILTRSRGAYLALLFVLILFLLFKKIFLKRKLKHFLPFFLIVLLVCIPFISIFLERLVTLESISSVKEDIQEGEKTSITIRYDLALKSIAAFISSPLIGIGIGNFKDYYLKHGIFKAERPTENAYLSMLANLGLLGFIMFIMIILYTMKNFIIAYRLGKSKFKLWIMASLIAFLGYSFYGITYNIQYEKPFWFLLALSVVSINIVNKNLTKNKIDKKNNKICNKNI